MKKVSKTINCRVWCTICLLSLLSLTQNVNAQGSVNPNDEIKFADKLIETLCIEKWDVNKDGKLSYAEAASVTSLEYVFNPLHNGWRSHGASFNELQYFTGLKSIGIEAFADCSNFAEVTIPNSVTTIGERAFLNCTNLKKVTFSNSLVSIGAQAFMGCGALQSVSLPTTTTSIEKQAFCHCGSIATLTANGVTEIGESAFDGCGSLKTMEINSVVNIADKAFNGCNSLDGFVLPTCLKSIGTLAFAECTSLRKFYSKAATPPVASENAFRGVSWCELYVPVNSKEDYQAANVWEQWFEAGEKTDWSGDNPRNSQGDVVNGFYNIETVDENGNYDVSHADKDVDVVLDENKIKEYGVDQDIEANSVTYVRTFSNYVWQALYLPVSVPMKNLEDNFEIAEIGINRVSSSSVCFVNAEEGIKPNVAYAIRLKEGRPLGRYTIDCENKIVATKDTIMVVNGSYVLKSSYSLKKGNEIEGKYVLSGEKFKSCSKNTTLKPFRFYLEASKSGTPGRSGRAKELDVFFDEETSMEPIAIGEYQDVRLQNVAFDLNGRIVSGNAKGLIIMNGKKYLR